MYCCKNGNGNRNGNAAVDNSLRELRADDPSCIDKTSRAELSEAINAMYEWYLRLTKGYAFLQDLPRGSTLHSEAFRPSRWFTRGWTLQELLAPRDLEFFDSDWTYPGVKHDNVNILANITGIIQVYLEYASSISNASIAKRMSWASSRETARLRIWRIVSWHVRHLYVLSLRRGRSKGILSTSGRDHQKG